ncbi:DNA polymerase IV [Fulvitalea axinellae]|uniref:DNA polymerase IV n=2 Tax=Fulvitalea axinellae TaxID=1182444 RepID=A0AAU9CNV8_9BACT|nr:DNA polymerase IV [Fulvitalea axinellae]
MDAFYASIEQRDNPALRGKPIGVGGTSRRGVLATASYEARQFGVRSAMPNGLALKKCPHLILVKSRFDVYKRVSAQIREIFHRYTDLVEPLSLDEAYLDVTEPKQGPPSATLLAEQIRKEVFETTQLTCSAGVSYNKFIAKTASDFNKPDGITVVLPDQAQEFLEKLPIAKFHGIGKVTAERMRALGIHSGADLAKADLPTLRLHFGKAGKFFYNIVRGIDDRPVISSRERKSIGAERTFEENISDLGEMGARLDDIVKEVSRRAEKSMSAGKTVTLKIKFSDFVQITRSKTLPNPVRSYEDLLPVIKELLQQAPLRDREVRLLGASLSNLKKPEELEGQQIKIPFPDL